MYNQDFRNYRLYRTLPKLSGNMKIDLIVEPGANSQAYIQQAHLRPISDRIHIIPQLDERMTLRTHQNNIKAFYAKVLSKFYDYPADPVLTSDWPWQVSNPEISNLKYLKNWDDTYMAGTQRMSYKLYGTTHECLIPVWLDQCDGLKLIIKLTSGNVELTSYEIDLSKRYQLAMDGTTPIKNLAQSFHNEFVDYFLNYLDYVGVIDGTNKVMNIDFKNNLCVVYGLNPETGSLLVHQNFNVTRNLMFRERPLLENNSLLTNTFRDMKLIIPNIINFNVCFDIDKFIPKSKYIRTLYKDQINISAEVQVLRKESDLNYARSNTVTDYSNPYGRDIPSRNIKGGHYSWQTLEVRDFYTNHDYIPKPTTNTEYVAGDLAQYRDSDNIKNALEYKLDYKNLDMMHQNKIVQPICHWVYAQQPDGDLFNVYDGFGAVTAQGEYAHGQGTTTDPADSTYNEGLDNTIWAGAPRIGDGDDIEATLNGPQQWVENEYFKDASNFINGLKFQYDPSKMQYRETADRVAPRKVYIGTMTTPWDSDVESWKTMATSIVSLSGAIGILTERKSGLAGSDLPKTKDDQYTSFDKGYDYHVHSDTDNRWHVETQGGNALYIDRSGRYIKAGGYAVGINNNSAFVLAKYKVQSGGLTTQVINGKTYSGCIVEIKYLERIGGSMPYNTSLRNLDNTSALYINMRRMHDRGELHLPNDPLCIIFWHGRAKKQIPSTSDKVIYEDLLPHGLTLGGVIHSLRDYAAKYTPMYDALINAKDDGIIPDLPPSLPDMGDFEVVLNVMTTIQVPEVIFFDNSIEPVYDDALSVYAQENHYVKTTDANAYVWRYGGLIKPAMFPPKTTRKNSADGNLIYTPTYGRNFLYLKQMFFPQCALDKGFYKHIASNIPPKYPSLDYESIVPCIRASVKKSDVCMPVPKGDIMYDEPLPQFFGLFPDGTPMATSEHHEYDTYIKQIEDNTIQPQTTERLNNLLSDSKFRAYFDMRHNYDTWEWFEYKWFDKSIVMNFPKTIECEIYSPNNDRATLETEALASMKVYINNLQGVTDKIDYNYLRNIYDIEYNLQDLATGLNKDPLSNEVLYTYRYKIIATLK